MPARLQGFNKLHKKLMELGDLEGGKVLRAGVTSATTPIVREARRRIPVNDRDYLKKTYKGRAVAPGFAKRSIAKKIILVPGKDRVIGLVGVKPEAFYAVNYVEIGTSDQAPQPWLRPAARLTRSEQLQRLGDTIKRKLHMVARK